MKPKFDHEKLNVYQSSLKFVVWSQEILDRLPKALSVWDQLDRSSTSIPLNIAEGNGKFTSTDRCRYFDIARGSALESAAVLDVLVAKQKLAATEIEEGKDILVQIVSMLIGLIKSNSSDRLYETPANYGMSKEE